MAPLSITVVRRTGIACEWNLASPSEKPLLPRQLSTRASVKCVKRLTTFPSGMNLYPYNVVFPLQFCRYHRGTADRFRRYSNGTATVRNLLIFIHNKTESGSSTQPAYWGDRMILWIFSIAGVIVGVFAAGKSISDSEALLLIGISLIGVAIRLRRGKGMRD